jgi:hypothetical protein
MESNSDDDSLELPKQKATKETIDALKSLQKEKKTLPKKPMSEARQATIAKMRAAREANCKLRAEAKALLLKNKESIEYTKEQKKSFKKKELEELKILLGKNKEQEPLPVAEPKQTNKPKKVIEKEPESEEDDSSEEEIIVKKKSKPKPKQKKKVTIYLSSDDDDESESDNEPPPPKQKSRIQRPNQIQQEEPVAPAIDYKSFFC